jgi:hypothetical protein
MLESWATNNTVFSDRQLLDLASTRLVDLVGTLPFGASAYPMTRRMVLFTVHRTAMHEDPYRGEPTVVELKQMFVKVGGTRSS